MQTKQKVVKMFTSPAERFDSYEKFQYALRKGGQLPDYVVVKGILYTMEEYDMDGKLCYYGNKRTGYTIEIHTADRYKTLADVVVNFDENDGLNRRADIAFAD